jgi:hypothetical protein
VRPVLDREGEIVVSGTRAIVLALAVALLAVPLTGCNTAKVSVRLLSFGNGNTDGLWFWRLENGSYKRICRIVLGNPYVSGGVEVVNYQQSCVDGRSSTVAWQATVKRLSNPANVELTFTYQRAGSPTTHRATAYNADGESPLSSTTLKL